MTLMNLHTKTEVVPVVKHCADFSAAVEGVETWTYREPYIYTEKHNQKIKCQMQLIIKNTA
jgi:hypothetical protein